VGVLRPEHQRLGQAVDPVAEHDPHRLGLLTGLVAGGEQARQRRLGGAGGLVIARG